LSIADAAPTGFFGGTRKRPPSASLSAAARRDKRHRPLLLRSHVALAGALVCVGCSCPSCASGASVSSSASPMADDFHHQSDAWDFFEAQLGGLTPPPSLVKCIGATLAGSIFALAGMLWERDKEAKKVEKLVSREELVKLIPKKGSTNGNKDANQTSNANKDANKTRPPSVDGRGDRTLARSASECRSSPDRRPAAVRQAAAAAAAAASPVASTSPSLEATPRRTQSTPAPAPSPVAGPVAAAIPSAACGQHGSRAGTIAAGASAGAAVVVRAGASPAVRASPSPSPPPSPSPSVAAQPSPLKLASPPVASSPLSAAAMPGPDSSRPRLFSGAPSPGGWSAASREVSEGERQERQVKLILNKLTREKFDSLYAQLVGCCEDCEARPEIVQVIAREVFAKATLQHTFIEMYADVCARLHADLHGKHTEVNFKRALLDQCQESFTKYLEAPRIDDTLDYDQQYEALVKYKTRMLGNVRLIGHLLRLRMLSPKIIFVCTDELLNIGSPEALETLCAFLETLGATFDCAKEWNGKARLDEVFARVELMALDEKQAPRIRCLLKDLLDKRRRKWREFPIGGPGVGTPNSGGGGGGGGTGASRDASKDEGSWRSNGNGAGTPSDRRSGEASRVLRRGPGPPTGTPPGSGCHTPTAPFGLEEVGVRRACSMKA